MGVESATYVSDLITSNPLAGDLRAQGDDHLRLIKSVLQATFPNAAHAFRFPGSLLAKTTGYTVVVADDSKVIPVDATGGAVTITLPANAGIYDGFYVLVVKVDSSSNAVTVDGSGSDPINGALTQVLSTQYDWLLVWWSTANSTWYGFKATEPVRNTNVSSTDLNSLLISGEYDGTSLTNAPGTGAWHVQVYVSSQDTNNVLQIATDLDTVDGATYIRTRVASSWGSWRKVVREDQANAFTGNNTFAGTGEHTKQANFTPRATLTDAANIAWNLETAQVAVVTLSANRVLDAPTNMKSGGTYILFVLQDATGTRTLSFNAAYKFPGGNDPVLSTGANAIDIISFVSDGTSLYGVCQKAFA